MAATVKPVSSSVCELILSHERCTVYINVTLVSFHIDLQDPEVMAAFQDVAQNPANISKYQSNPKIMALVTKLSAKFGAPPQP